MQNRKLIAALAAALVTAGAGIPGSPAEAGAGEPSQLSPLATWYGRQALPAGDGWGSAGAGTTGGAAASPDQVYVVTSRAELTDALRGDAPKIVFVQGTIDGFEGPAGALLGCDDLADPAYDFDDYLATFDPEVWGRETEPAGPLEDARVRSMRNQEAQTVLKPGSNTTLIGLRGATLLHTTLLFNEADNVIIRNLTIRDAFDCFPQWDPTDGDLGNWNSNWDYVSVRRGTNFWIDHNTFVTPNVEPPSFFGRKFETYDGLLDITHTADLVTISHNVFRDHDKAVLIGSTDNPGGGDPGRLNVTLRHNLFDGLGQRAPRVRFGQVDVYNNYYRIPVAAPFEYGYSWGVGVESAIYAENNYFSLSADDDPATVIADWGGTAITERGTWARTGGSGFGRPVSLLDAYNAVSDPALGDDAGWTPQLRRGPVLPAPGVPVLVGLFAGADRLPI
ncbi:MAG: pectate lyase [Micromonosporaceae bacterium]|nr:pectate lyase [Micromonosporaceae bacterium]